MEKVGKWSTGQKSLGTSGIEVGTHIVGRKRLVKMYIYRSTAVKEGIKTLVFPVDS